MQTIALTTLVGLHVWMWSVPQAAVAMDFLGQLQHFA